MGWLEILGLIFLGVLLIAAYFGFKFYRWIKRSADQFNEMAIVQMVLPPINFEIHSAPEANWTQQARLLRDQQWLRDSGFTHEGDFDTIMGQAEALISLWGHADLAICCAIYECRVYLEDQDDFHTVYASELFQTYADGSSLAVSNSADAGTLPRPQKDRLVIEESESLGALHQVLVQQAPNGVPVKALGNVVNAFQNFVEEYNAWLWEEAQLRDPTVAALLEKVGVELSEDLLQRLLEEARCEKSEWLSRKILRRLSERANMTAANWEQIRERMVVVHQKMTADEIINSFYELLGEVCEKDEERIDAIAELEHIACPVTLFSTRLTQLKAANRIKLVAKMEVPVLSYVYMPKTI
ncbi:hypothetical protein [Simiduia aestuariiviva]|uniref:Uncharacterized protein n=1 Tax=Simiduia aestuariiviva TaxID=1510459 RepID=A0A839UNB1_9GAMM|nr:hypothetical protein [Simiduia aestuariiviva]MBB3169664.1 hypothetical protein [Simiduia aestuariiviva]